MLIRTLLFATVALMNFVGLARGFQGYELLEIGVDHVYARGLNDHDEVVGYVNPGGAWTDSYGFLWSRQAGLQSIDGYLAEDINEERQVVGSVAKYAAGIWAGGTWTPLTGRQGASSINDLGQVTGLISSQGRGPYAPHRTDHWADPQFITLQRPYAYASHSNAINHHGDVVADCGTPGPALYVAVFYDAHGKARLLADDGNYDTHPGDINDHRWIVGRTTVKKGDTSMATLWTAPDAPMTYLGQPGDGGSRADAINNLGQVVGQSGGRAFLWIPRKGVQVDLNTLVKAPAGVTLTRATDINDRSTIITYGTDSAGRNNSYVLMRR